MSTPQEYAVRDGVLVPEENPHRVIRYTGNHADAVAADAIDRYAILSVYDAQQDADVWVVTRTRTREERIGGTYETVEDAVAYLGRWVEVALASRS
jgi:hypothetical protein